jgi:hypothetical protein
MLTYNPTAKALYGLFMDQGSSAVPKPVTPAYSHYCHDALVLLSQMIKRARIDRRMTMRAVAERTGISIGVLSDS